MKPLRAVGSHCKNIYELIRLEALLQKYADSGITSVESMEILRVDPLRAFGTPVEIINLFGSRENYLTAIRELETALYQKAA